jgi:cell division protein FtsA
MRKIFSSMDIGSDSIKIVVLELLNDKLNVLASNIYPSEGVKYGTIINEEEAKKTIIEAFKKINNSLGVKVDKVLASVPMYDAKYTLVEGYTSITNEDKIINSDDILNTLQASIYNKIKEKEELVTVMPVKYIIDDKHEVLNPKGLSANKLSVLAMMVTVSKVNLYKYLSVISKCNVEVVDLLFNPIGDYYCFKNSDLDRTTVGVINIGLQKTELAVFNKGIITNSSVIREGSYNIDEDLSYAYNIDIEKAKKIKEMFAVADKEYASKSEIFEIKDKSKIKVKINQFEASEIVENSLKEILKNSKKVLNDLTKKEISYIIITGGISNIPGFENICNNVLKDSSFFNKIKIIGIRDNRYSSTYGMIKYFVNKLSIRGREYTMFDGEKEIELIERINKVEDTTVFGKLFGKLFENKED